MQPVLVHETITMHQRQPGRDQRAETRGKQIMQTMIDLHRGHPCVRRQQAFGQHAGAGTHLHHHAVGRQRQLRHQRLQRCGIDHEVLAETVQRREARTGERRQHLLFEAHGATCVAGAARNCRSGGSNPAC